MNAKTKSPRSSVGARIRQLRQDRRWTQAQLAELLGLSQNYLSVLERGQGSFTAEQLLTILRYFNVSIDYFSPRKSEIGSQIQNALARQGAVHLMESSDLLPSERLKNAADGIREALVFGDSPRQIAAIAPILVDHAGDINLDKLHSEFKELGLEYRLGWAIDTILEAIKAEEGADDATVQWRLKCRRARVIVDEQTRGWRSQPREGGNISSYAVFDAGITSEEGLKEAREELSAAAKRWRVVTRLGVEDFIKALRAARGAD